MEVSRLFQESFKVVSRVFQGRFKSVSRKCLGCFKEVSSVFQESIMGGSLKIEGCFNGF